MLAIILYVLAFIFFCLPMAWAWAMPTGILTFIIASYVARGLYRTWHAVITAILMFAGVVCIMILSPYFEWAPDIGMYLLEFPLLTYVVTIPLCYTEFIDDIHG